MARRLVSDVYDAVVLVPPARRPIPSRVGRLLNAVLDSGLQLPSQDVALAPTIPPVACVCEMIDTSSVRSEASSPARMLSKSKLTGIIVLRVMASRCYR